MVAPLFWGFIFRRTIDASLFWGLSFALLPFGFEVFILDEIVATSLLIWFLTSAN